MGESASASRDPDPGPTAPSDPFRTMIGIVGVIVVAVWHRLLPGVVGPSGSATDREEPRIVEHERAWGPYLRGFDTHHGSGEGSLRFGLARWVKSGFLRGYTLGNDVYVCPRTPLAVRVHQAGHTPAFGAAFDPIHRPRRADGGLPDEPLRSLDVMLPGGLPHTFLRLRDRRGLRAAYRAWLEDGRIRRRRDR